MALYFSAKSLFGLDEYVGLILPKKDVYATQQAAIMSAVFVALCVFIFGLLFVKLLSRSISRPITQLAEESEHMTHDVDAQSSFAPNSSIEEILTLQKAFYSFKQFMQSFERYIPKTLMRNIIKHEVVAHVGGDSRKVTVMFIDIAHFTTLSETMAPQQLMHFLSDYFEAMTKVIFKHGGTLDKYIGDAMMVFWGAPSEDTDQAIHACQCALELQETVRQWNLRLQETNYPILTVKIGIHTGFAVVGNVGSTDRLNYTAIGDVVNLASRLEALNPYYGVSCILSETTFNEVKGVFSVRFLDYVAVHGKHQPVYIYELIDLKAQTESTYSKDEEIKFHEALQLYRSGEWDKALAAFEELALLRPHDMLMKCYVERCRLLKSKNPEDWTGVWTMEHK